MIRRRKVITLLGGAAVAWPLAARAQQGERMRRVGVLFGAADDHDGRARFAAFRQALQELGWTVKRGRFDPPKRTKPSQIPFGSHASRELD